MKGRSILWFIVLTVFALLTACTPGEKAPKAAEEEPAIWMFKKGEKDSKTGELYVKRMNQEPEKVANEVAIGNFVPYPDAKRVLFLDGENNLYAWETGKEKEKVDSDVQFHSIEISADGQKIYYLNSDQALYVLEKGKEKSKLGSEVSSYRLAGDGGTVYYLDDASSLYRIPPAGDKEKLASDVNFFEVSRDTKSVVYQSEESMIYVLRDQGVKYKLSNSNAGDAYISSDGGFVTLTDEFNTDKGYGELYLSQWGKNEYAREKIASDIRNHFISWDEKSVYYLNSENHLYQFDIKSKQKTKVASEINELEFSKDHQLFAYLNKDEDLYVWEAGKEAEKVASEIRTVQVMDNKAVYYDDKDGNIYVKLYGKEKAKIELNAEEYSISNEILYYATKDHKIGVVLPGKTEGTFLLEQVEPYQSIYSSRQLLYQKLAKIEDVSGYWYSEEEKGYVFFEKSGDQEMKMSYYHLDEEEILKLQVDHSEEDKLYVTDLENDEHSAVIIINGKDQITLSDDDSENIIFKRSSKEELDKMKANVEAENKQILSTFEKSIRALEQEDLEGYLATIDQDSYVYEETQETMAFLFETYDGIKYEIESSKMIERSEDEAVVEVVQITRGSGPDFADNKTVTEHTLIKSSDGTWKVSNSNVIDMEYLE
ncbi:MULTISPECIES: hypothetical protein [unclassified Paenibacillus]|uniref:hypothetical protein n=1 Tax=unclassified Paenibacillus TaxID=185978 RepID=UPI001AEB8AA2|nr:MULTISPECIES: hypothetical protein [unclassified Paenibacillus]MBP1157411.1 WD40 repeat protein [Paenibacillus sp. PvP091]MBP1171851.1 WD40 repeat protein [Paenibacillus sp. PvR098]MBP2438232.1 WD40 repeat protein [Paenibacillus sp. PvP052]